MPAHSRLGQSLITGVELGPVSAQVGIVLKSGDEITATITTAAARRLKLKKGKEALAIVKAAAITASVTNEAVEALALKVGAPATAVFKAYSVLVAAQV